jgi:predicted molibdopterin-dependent oxidoreductase YjgC
VTETICPYCGVGCAVELHVQDDRILKVTSPLDSSVTEGHLCIKGRFGFEFVNERPKTGGGAATTERTNPGSGGVPPTS